MCCIYKVHRSLGTEWHQAWVLLWITVSKKCKFLLVVLWNFRSRCHLEYQYFLFFVFCMVSSIKIHEYWNMQLNKTSNIMFKTNSLVLFFTFPASMRVGSWASHGMQYKSFKLHMITVTETAADSSLQDNMRIWIWADVIIDPNDP